MKTDIIHQFLEQCIPFDIFSVVTYLDGLVNLVDESNLYAQQKCREFNANEQKIKSFLRINCIMSINKIPAIKVTGNVDSSLVIRALEKLWLEVDLRRFY